MENIGDYLVSSFPNYKKEMYDGNEPCGKGHRMENGEFADRWETKFGSGETYKDEILNFSFSLSHRITIYIVGDVLSIVDNRYAGKTDEWCYFSNPSKGRVYGCFESRLHELEKERIDEYLNKRIPDCKIWNMVSERAKEIYNSGVRL